MRFVLKFFAFLIVGPVLLALMVFAVAAAVIAAAAVVVAGPMLLERAKDFLGMAAGPQAGAEPTAS